MSGGDEIIRHAVDLALGLPASQARKLASLLECPSGPARGDFEFLDALPQPEARKKGRDFLEAWRASAFPLTAEAVAAALRAGVETAERLGMESSVELVWTGLPGGSIPMRRTEQVLLELINTAQKHLLFVTYAIYRARNLGEALLAAVRRGVRLTILLEPSDPEVGSSVLKALDSLHPDLSRSAEVLIWPVEKRIPDEHGQAGVLHAKCAVADGRILFLSSANLTGAALTVNMELGVLIRGGPLPLRVVHHFEDLRQQGVLASL